MAVTDRPELDPREAHFRLPGRDVVAPDPARLRRRPCIKGASNVRSDFHC